MQFKTEISVLERNQTLKTMQCSKHPTHTAPSSTSVNSATPDPKAMTPSKKSKHEEFKTQSYAAQSSPSMNYATPVLKALTSTPGPLVDNIQSMSDMSRMSSSQSESQAEYVFANIMPKLTIYFNFYFIHTFKL